MLLRQPKSLPTSWDAHINDTLFIVDTPLARPGRDTGRGCWSPRGLLEGSCSRTSGHDNDSDVAKGGGKMEWLGGSGIGGASRKSTCDHLEMGMNETLCQYKGKDSGLILARQGQCGGR